MPLPICKDNEICLVRHVITTRFERGTSPICNLLLGVFHSSILGGMAPSQYASGKMKVFPTKNVITLVVVSGKGPYPMPFRYFWIDLQRDFCLPS